MLTALFDRLGELVAVTASTRGARAKVPPTAPRPAYAVAQVRKRLRQETHRSLVQKLIRPKPAG
jgi:hypothetical protein